MQKNPLKESLLRAYKSAVLQAARRHKIKYSNFMEALLRLPEQEADDLRESFRIQIEAIDAQDGENARNALLEQLGAEDGQETEGRRDLS